MNVRKAIVTKIDKYAFTFCDLASIGTESCGEYQQNFLGKLQIRVTFFYHVRFGLAQSPSLYVTA